MAHFYMHHVLETRCKCDEQMIYLTWLQFTKTFQNKFKRIKSIITDNIGETYWIIHYYLNHENTKYSSFDFDFRKRFDCYAVTYANKLPRSVKSKLLKLSIKIFSNIVC